MNYCTKCGAALQDNAAFCASCGAPVEKAAGENQQNYNQSYGQTSQTYVNYNDPAADASANKVYGILAYLGILVLVTIFAAPKESKYSKFHANQGLVLAIGAIGLSVVLSIVTAIISAILGFSLLLGSLAVFGLIVGLIWTAYGVCWLILAIMGIVNAANGECKPLPIIGKFTILK